MYQICKNSTMAIVPGKTLLEMIPESVKEYFYMPFVVNSGLSYTNLREFVKYEDDEVHDQDAVDNMLLTGSIWPIVDLADSKKATISFKHMESEHMQFLCSKGCDTSAGLVENATTGLCECNTSKNETLSLIGYQCVCMEGYVKDFKGDCLLKPQCNPLKEIYNSRKVSCDCNETAGYLWSNTSKSCQYKCNKGAGQIYDTLLKTCKCDSSRGLSMKSGECQCEPGKVISKDSSSGDLIGKCRLSIFTMAIKIGESWIIHLIFQEKITQLKIQKY